MAGLLQVVQGAKAADTLKPRPPDGQRRRRSTLLEQTGDKRASADNRITLEQLSELREKFETAMKEGNGELEEEEFVDLLGPILSSSMDRHELRKLFVRVDANANGSVDWDELSTFILLSGEHKQKEALLNACYVRRADTGKTGLKKRHPDYHMAPTTTLLCHPRNGKYYTCGRDGMVKSWNSTSLELEQTIHPAGSWITDAVFLKNDTRLAVCSMDKVVSVFDLASTSGNGGRLWRAFVGKKHAKGKEERSTLTHGGLDTGDTSSSRKKILDTRSVAQFRSLSAYKKEVQKMLTHCSKEPQTVAMTVLQDLQDCPMSMSAWEGRMCLGLKNGSLQLYDLASFSHSDNDFIPCEATYKLHSAPISKVKTSRYVDGVITAGWDNTIRIVSLERGKVTRVLSDGPRTKSIFSLDWSENYRLLASAGAERQVLLWNPYISRPVYKLEGHHHPLHTVCFNAKHDQLLSLSQDKCVKVWDLRTMKCLQTIPHDDAALAREQSVSSLAFDSARGCLVCASDHPIVFPIKSVANLTPEGAAAPASAEADANSSGEYGSDSNDKDPLSEAAKSMPLRQQPVSTAHTQGICCIKANYQFDQIITTDSQKCCIWDLATGVKVSTYFPPADSVITTSREHTLDQDSIVGVDLDGTGRRIILGTSSRIHILNGANGQLLKELVLKDNEGNRVRGTANKEINAVIYLAESQGKAGAGGKHVLACVGDGVVLWADNATELSGRVMHHCSLVDVVNARPELRDDFESCFPAAERKRGSLTCVCKMPRSLVAIGTDFGVTILYSYVRNEIFNRLVGRPFPGVSVDYLSYSTETEMLLIASDITIIFWSFKDKCFCFSIKQESSTAFTSLLRSLNRVKDDEPETETAAAVCAGYAGDLADLDPPQLYRGSNSGYRSFLAAEQTTQTTRTTQTAQTKAGSSVVSGDDSGRITVWGIAARACTDPPTDEVVAADPAAWVQKVTSFQAHVGAVTHIQLMYVMGETFIISAGVDSQLRIHSLVGKFIGVFGQPEQWDLHDIVARHKDRLAKAAAASPEGTPLRQPKVKLTFKQTAFKALDDHKRTSDYTVSFRMESPAALYNEGEQQPQPQLSSSHGHCSGPITAEDLTSGDGRCTPPPPHSPVRVLSPQRLRQLEARATPQEPQQECYHDMEPYAVAMRGPRFGEPKTEDPLPPDDAPPDDVATPHALPPPPIKVAAEAAAATSGRRRRRGGGEDGRPRAVSPPVVVRPPGTPAPPERPRVSLLREPRVRGLPTQRMQELGTGIVGDGGCASGVFGETAAEISRTHVRLQQLEAARLQQMYQSSLKRYCQGMHKKASTQQGFDANDPDPKHRLSYYKPLPVKLDFSVKPEVYLEQYAAYSSPVPPADAGGGDAESLAAAAAAAEVGAPAASSPDERAPTPSAAVSQSQAQAQAPRSSLSPRHSQSQSRSPPQSPTSASRKRSRVLSVQLAEAEAEEELLSWSPTGTEALVLKKKEAGFQDHWALRATSTLRVPDPTPVRPPRHAFVTHSSSRRSEQPA